MVMQPTLDFIPLWGFMIITIAVVVVFVEIGFRIGKQERLNRKHPGQAPIGSIVGATLGLLAFILAFTFGMASTRFETRRTLVLEESNAIGTTYLRADYLEEPERSEIQKLLREYATLRISVLTPEQLQDVIEKSELLQDKLWAQAKIVAKNYPNSIVIGLFIQSLNDVIDIHAKRVMAILWSRIPISIWTTLLFLTILSMLSMGYMSGLDGTRSNVTTLTLILAFASVIFLISDLDRPREGSLIVSQQSMIDVQKKMSR